MKLKLLTAALLLTTGCSPEPTNNTSGSPATSKYITTVENCDIFYIRTGEGTMYLSKCSDTKTSGVAWEDSHQMGKTRVTDEKSNATVEQTPYDLEKAKQTRREQDRVKLLEKLTPTEKELLGL